MGVAGRQADGVEARWLLRQFTATQVRESPSRPGVIWVGTEDGNLQVSQDGGETFTNVIGNIARRAQGLHAHLAHRALALRSGHRLRRDRQPSQRRLEALPVQDHRLRQDLDQRRRQPARQGPHQRAARRLRQSESAVRRHRIRSVHHARRRQGVEEVHDRHAASVRVDDILIHPRDRDLIVGDPRPVDLDRRRHHAAGTAQGAGNSDIDALRSAARRAVEERSAGPAPRGQSRIQRQEPAGRTAISILANPISAPASWSSCRGPRWSAPWTSRSRPA